MFCFFFNDTATTDSYPYLHTLSLHVARLFFEEFADGNGRHGMLPDQHQPLLILRRRRIFHPEQAVGLETLAETCRLDGRQPMMHVVQEMDAEAVLFAPRVTQLRSEVEILFCRPDLFLGQIG